jgi:heterodisulfide reductase subunit D
LDGKPVLACKTELGEGDHWVEPLPGFEVVKDLEVDKSRASRELEEVYTLLPRSLDTEGLMNPDELRIKPLLGCLHCGICTSGCTTRDIDWGAGARMKVAEYVVDITTRHQTIQRKKWSPPNELQAKILMNIDEIRPPPLQSNGLYRHMLICSACGRCEEFCPTANKNKIQVLELAKERLVSRGALPVHEKLMSYIPYHNSYGEPHEARLAWLPEGIKLHDRADIALFLGCSACYRTQESARAIVTILQHLGVEFALPGDEWCCGSPYLRAGIGQRIKQEHMPHNVENLRLTGAKIVLTPCSGCFRTFNKDYPVYYGELPFKVMHIVQYIAQKLKEGLVLPQVKLMATFHDSCHMGRGMGEYDAPREVIEAMGIKLVEMTHCRRNSHCCGGGGGLRSGFKEISLGIARKRVLEAQETGVDTILTACVFCTRNLNDGAQEMGASIRAKNIETVLAEAIHAQR